MRFDDQFLTKLRDRLTLSEIVGKHVRLERKGREFLGNCPFHQEKTPSFTVNDDKQFFHCFGCAAHGDVIKFASLIRGMNFAESVEFLAQEAGLELPKEEHHLPKEIIEQGNELLQAMKLAKDYFVEQLKLLRNRSALEYLHNRGINDHLINHFELGFAPHDNSLLPYLQKHNVSQSTMLKVGLSVKGQNNDYYSRFRDRIMFPIFDHKNRVIAFGGRAMGDNLPKYLNSPETILFKKSETLYGLNFAKEAGRKAGRILVVEGYIDLISMHAAGLKETVSCLGTAITESHIKKLWYVAPEPIICLDGDNAGQKAAFRTAEHAAAILKPGYSLRFASLPDNKDPDELLRCNGKELMDQVLNNARPMAEVIWSGELAKLPSKPTPEQKAALEVSLNKLTEKMSDKIVRNYYRNYFNSNLWQLGRLHNVAGQQNNISAVGRLKNYTSEMVNPIKLLEQNLISIIMSFPDLLSQGKISEEFISLELTDEKLDNLRTVILEANSVIGEINQETLRLYLEENQIIYNINSPYNQSANMNLIERFGNVDSIWAYNLNKYHILILEKEYQAELKKMTEDSASKASIIREQIMDIKANIAKLETLLES